MGKEKGYILKNLFVCAVQGFTEAKRAAGKQTEAFYYSEGIKGTEVVLH